MYRVFEEYFPIDLTWVVEETTNQIVFYNNATLKVTSLNLFEGIKSKEMYV